MLKNAIDWASRPARASVLTGKAVAIMGAIYRYDSLDAFLRVFWLAESCLTTRGDWARVAYESVVDGADHGVGCTRTASCYHSARATAARGPGRFRHGAAVVAACGDGRGG